MSSPASPPAAAVAAAPAREPVCAPASPPAPTVSRDVPVVGDAIARHAGKALRVEIDDPAVRLDLNTPADHRRVHAAEAARAAR